MLEHLSAKLFLLEGSPESCEKTKLVSIIENEKKGLKFEKVGQCHNVKLATGKWIAIDFASPKQNVTIWAFFELEAPKTEIQKNVEILLPILRRSWKRRREKKGL